MAFEATSKFASGPAIAVMPGAVKKQLSGLSRARDEFWPAAIGFAVTIAASFFSLADIAEVAAGAIRRGDYAGLAQEAVFATIVIFLIYGSLVYQLTRSAYYQRQSLHRAPADEILRQLHRETAPRVAVLVPAYKEEESVVLQTLLSAALLEYPFKQITLLIDDPPATEGDPLANLERMRALPRRVGSLLEPAASQCRDELTEFLARKQTGRVVIADEGARLAELFVAAARQFERIGAVAGGFDHVGVFFRQHVTGVVARDLREKAAEWSNLAQSEECSAGMPTEVESAYRRLASLFSAEISTFERKRFRNLCHSPNKAMNLNAYLDLMGKTVREVGHPDGSTELVVCGSSEQGRQVPDSDYVITLDADSLLLNDYALRLVDFLERPENGKIAIVQTPYSAFPNPGGTLERVAGITTDIQHVVHQGFTQFGSTYWVGANALIRKPALHDIVETVTEDGKSVRKFIQDRTVIEDTESTVDLLLKGWSLHNYPARLAYSATPPDFGSLLVQRRRWANGGLIILPKLLRYIAQHPRSMKKFCEGLIQAHYLSSISASSIGVLAMLLFPFEQSMRSWWLPVSALPYFLLYGLDMRRIGYRWSDLFRVYALNLVLVPVHLGGVLASLRQIVTGRKAPFVRTPKVVTRTTAPPSYVLAVFALAAYCLTGAMVDAFAGRWAHAAFATLNGVFVGYGAAGFVGIRAAIEDLGLASWFFADPAKRPAFARSGGWARRTAATNAESVFAPTWRATAPVAHHGPLAKTRQPLAAQAANARTVLAQQSE